METPAFPPEQDKTSTGLEQNTAALLSYIFTWVTGLIFYLLEKDNKYVRFHALQSILFGVASAILFLLVWLVSRLLGLVPVPGYFIGTVLWFIWWVSYVVVVIILMVKSYQGERYKLPVIGDIAERNV